MEQEMSHELVVGIVVMVFQFGILIIISLISYIFKTSIDNILAMIKEMKSDRISDIRNREKNDDEIFYRLRTVESKVVVLEAKE